MTQTHNLKLNYLAPAQAQKHVTVNEALRRLDMAVQPSIISKDLTSPPVNSAQGDCYIIGSPAIGAWASHENDVAAWTDGAWVYLRPHNGWQCYIIDQAGPFVFDGAAWQPSGLRKGDLNLIPRLGINTSSDDVNRLSVKSDAILFDNAGHDAQVKINKSAPADSAALLFQNGYIGAAEVGLTGDNNLHFKVSGDGSAWHDALEIDASSAVATFPQEKTVIAGDEPQLVLNSKKTGVNSQGDEYGQIVFYSEDPDHGSLPGSQGRIVMTHTRPGTGHLFADAGMVFETLNIAGQPQRALVLESSQNNVTIGESLEPNCKLVVEGQIKVAVSTVGGLPAATNRAGAIAYVSNEAGGPTLVFCDGTHWRRVWDRAIVS